ncbi:hypothetical protein [Caldicellulosiruptor acetigenus]|uniref:Uncharacterized protein n=1 Tax=Caldicellulosiruptor acetigenus 6A TaxID=632516 RepID=G2PX07_9FIRM|nr:hypothetical protein [Caldicellulosiruptor acetigenus]AEM72962.1 hypothetical protein Calla_0289 [Caldicellulosiruptor acetigenus 6A]
MHAVYAYAGAYKNNQSITLPLTVSGSGKSGPINYSASGSVLKTEAQVSTQIYKSNNYLNSNQKVGAKVEAKAGVTLVEAGASVGVGPVSYNTSIAQGKATIGGKAEVNLKNFSASGGVEAGAYLLDWKNTIGVKIGGVNVEVGGALKAGVGGELKGEVSKKGISIKFGGVLGVGGSVILDIRW